MASITIRNLDERTKSRLRIQAAHHNRSMEEEARHIIREALVDEGPSLVDLAETIRKRFEPLGGVELQLPACGGMRERPS